MTTTGPFASAEEFSELTGLQADRARIQAHLSAASDLVRGYTGQTISRVLAEVEVLEKTDSDRLLLSERPVTAISTLVVNGVTQGSTTYTVTRWGLVVRVSGQPWNLGATVTYDHGLLETDWEWGVVRSVTMDVAARSLSLNERSASEAMGSSLMETAGYSPETFLTEGEKARLSIFGPEMLG